MEYLNSTRKLKSLFYLAEQFIKLTKDFGYHLIKISIQIFNESFY